MGLFVAFTTIWIVYGHDIVQTMMNMTDARYDPFETKDQNIDFSCVDDIYAYVPEVIDEQFEYPLLACDISSLDKKLISWSEPSSGYSHWNLINDVASCTESDASGLGDSSHNSDDSSSNAIRPIFSIIKHYPPAWRMLELQEMENMPLCRSSTETLSRN